MPSPYRELREGPGRAQGGLIVSGLTYNKIENNIQLLGIASGRCLSVCRVGVHLRPTVTHIGNTNMILIFYRIDHILQHSLKFEPK